MDLRQLAAEHSEMSNTLSRWKPQQILLWYADLDASVQGENVAYRCPHCGANTSMRVEEFVSQDTNLDLYCNDCRGELEERGGPMG
ncbi:MAG: hypothetical protein FJ315_09005 [SAR202 cluster bacterium]|nr:hypothetical protein [SAR202 cluster bacterium]